MNSQFSDCFLGTRALRRVAAVIGMIAVAVGQTLAAEMPLAKMANGEVVTEADFNTYIARRIDLKPIARNYWGAERALREMLTTRVLVLEGLRTKVLYRGGEEPVRFDDAYGLAVYRGLAKSCPTADAKTAKKFFDEHPEVFTAPPSARLARVMLPVSHNVDGVSSMAWLMQRASEIAQQKLGFEKVVERAAQIYKLETQGDLGWVNIDGDAAIMRALAGARSGEMIGPVQDGDFAYLFLLGEKRDARRFKWNEVEASAPNKQMMYCREQANKEVTEKLFKKYGVAIDDVAVKGLFNVPAVRSISASSVPKASK